MPEHDVRKKEKEREGVLEMIINSFEVDSITRDGFYPVSLNTSRGMVYCRYYASHERTRAVIFVGGEEGGWDSPVRSLMYPRLSSALSRKNINCLRIQYRHPNVMAESMLDVLAGITFLTQEGATSVGVVGYGQGAAVAIQAAAISPHVSTVVAVSPRVFGFNALASFRKNQSLLLLHGTDDRSASAAALSLFYQYARGDKKIIFYSKTNKSLDEMAPEAFYTTRDWLQRHII